MGLLKYLIFYPLYLNVNYLFFDLMRSRHPIYPQKNVVIVNSSSISNQTDELDFLESITRDIILAKGTGGNFFAEGSNNLRIQR